VSKQEVTRVIAALPKQLETEFRQYAMKKFGMKRGYLKKAFIEAIQTWINIQKEEKR